MSYVVDTDVLSHSSPSSAHCRLAGAQLRGPVSLSGVADGDQLRIAWLRHRRATRKATLLQVWLDDLIAFHQPRIIKVDDDVALHAGLLLARARAAGTEVDSEDALIAATADLNAMTC